MWKWHIWRMCHRLAEDSYFPTFLPWRLSWCGFLYVLWVKRCHCWLWFWHGETCSGFLGESPVLTHPFNQTCCLHKCFFLALYTTSSAFWQQTNGASRDDTRWVPPAATDKADIFDSNFIRLSSSLLCLAMLCICISEYINGYVSVIHSC